MTARRIAERIQGPEYAIQGVPDSSVHAKRARAVVLEERSTLVPTPPHPTRLHTTPPPSGARSRVAPASSRSVAPVVSASVHTDHAGMHSPRVCPVCQRAFVPTRSDQTYHSRACKEAATHRRSHPPATGSPVSSLCRCCGRSFVQVGKVGRNLAYCGAACREAAALWRADVRWWADVAAGWAPTRDAEMIEWSRTRLARVRALSGADYLKTHPWPVPHSTPGMERMYAFCQRDLKRR